MFFDLKSEVNFSIWLQVQRTGLTEAAGRSWERSCSPFSCTQAEHFHAITESTLFKAQYSSNLALTCSREAFRCPTKTKEVKEREGMERQEFLFCNWHKTIRSEYGIQRLGNGKYLVREVVKFAVQMGLSISATTFVALPIHVRPTSFHEGFEVH